MPQPPPIPVDWSAVAAAADYLVPLPCREGSLQLFMRFRRIPAGTFLMGSRGHSPREEPRHRVEIPHDFWLGKYAVTQEEWAAVVNGLGLSRSQRKPLKERPSHFIGERRPVEQVSWEDCVTWCRSWSGWLCRLFPGAWFASVDVALPSEAHWEYACRMTRASDFWNGDGEEALRAVGWFATNSGDQTHAVDEPVVSASPEQHPAGLVGMHGNVWEWCADEFDDSAYRRRKDGWRAGGPWAVGNGNGGVPEVRVVRGGSWRGNAGRCRSAYRLRGKTYVRYVTRGFRVCLMQTPGGETKGSLGDIRRCLSGADQTPDDHTSESPSRTDALNTQEGLA